MHELVYKHVDGGPTGRYKYVVTNEIQTDSYPAWAGGVDSDHFQKLHDATEYTLTVYVRDIKGIEATKEATLLVSINPAPELRSLADAYGDLRSELMAPYPNPSNPEVWIPFSLASTADVVLTIYSLDGRQVRKIELGHRAAGRYISKGRAAHWDGRNEFGERVASGTYVYRIQAGEFAQTRRMLVMK